MTLQQELAGILKTAPLETSVLAPFVELSLADGRPDDALLALERFVLLDSDPSRAARIAPRLDALRRSIAARRSARVPRQPVSRPLTVLMASVSGPSSIATFYERAWRRRHQLITFGPWRGPDYWRRYADTLRAHSFYQEGAAEAWLDVAVRDTRPCDIVVEPGIVDMQEVMARLPEGVTPDLLVWIDQDRFNLPLNLHLVNCPTVALIGDSHLGLDWRLRYARHFDHIRLMFNRHHGRHFEALGCQSVGWLPAACDPEVHAPAPASEKRYDIAFVGSTHPELHAGRVALIRRLETHGLRVHVDCRPPQASARIFAESRIVFNASIGDDLNMRVFEGLASGSLLVTNRLPADSGLGDLFTEGEDLVAYGSEEELVARLRYYLDPAHAGERETIAARGRARVLDGHTYDDRVSQIVSVLDEPASAGIFAGTWAARTSARSQRPRSRMARARCDTADF